MTDRKSQNQLKLERPASAESHIMRSSEERLAGMVNENVEDEKELSQESQFTNSVVRIDIEDLVGSQTMNITTQSLRLCKERILIPYSRLLKLIGWKRFGKDGYGNSWGVKILNSVYVCMILILVVYSYVYDIMACQWKLDIKKDIKLTPTVTAPTSIPSKHTHPSPSNQTSKPLAMYTINGTAIEMIPPDVFHQVFEEDALNNTSVCEHIATTYIIPNLLHIAAYLLGLWYFRVKEHEHLYALMEKVFLQTANLQSKAISQTNLVKKLRSFFIMGIVWIILTLCLQGLFVFSFGMERENLLSTMTSTKEKETYLIWLWGLFAIDLFGVAASNSINLAVVLNYSIQCEMLRYYINAIGARLKERSTDLKSAMKDVLNVRESISLLNSSIARMTSLVVIRFAEMFIIGLCILILNEDDQWKIWLYRSLFPVVWALIMVFPLVQAASMNAACAKFKTVALNIRVYGYQNSLDSELDSFLLFIANTTLRSKLFHIPVKPSYLLASTIVVCFTLLLLFQTSYLGPAARLF